LHPLLLRLMERWQGEIGAHLHHWNTPPFEPLDLRAPIPSEALPRDLLEAKLQTLLATLRRMGIAPRSFRMGRFSMGPALFGLLEQTSIRVDSSIEPTRAEYGGPDHMAAPTDPYFPLAADPLQPGDSSLLEVPLTILPLVPRLGRLAGDAARRFPAVKTPIAALMKTVGSLPAQPMMVGPRRLQQAVRLHRRRGGQVVTLYFHSSELLPGASPRHRTQRQVDSFVERLSGFLAWLRRDMGMDSLPLAELRQTFPAGLSVKEG